MYLFIYLFIFEFYTSIVFYVFEKYGGFWSFLMNLFLKLINNKNVLIQVNGLCGLVLDKHS